MKTIAEMLRFYIRKGMTANQAECFACQKIILSKISKSPFADKILIKGGIVMFCRSGNLRRATMDLDFDFIRYDISDSSIRSFVELLNRFEDKYVLSVIDIEPLHQEDYRGKRVNIRIQDNTAEAVLKMDIGVHTLLGIGQDSICFSFMDGEGGIILLANPPEQIFAEKAYSLAKHGAFSGRSKDIFDMYYLLKECELDKQVVAQCLDLLTMKGKFGIGSKADVYESIEDSLHNQMFRSRLYKIRNKWVKDDIETICQAIIDFIYTL